TGLGKCLCGNPKRSGNFGGSPTARTGAGTGQGRDPATSSGILRTGYRFGYQNRHAKGCGMASTAPVALVDPDAAYEIYLANGRSQAKVCEATGIPLGTIKRWAHRGNWPDRAKQDERLRRRLI